MILQKQFYSMMTLLSVFLFIISCSSKQSFVEEASFKLGQITYYNWSDGNRSGINLSIPVVSNKNKVVFDSIYFSTYQAKIERNNLEYTALIITETRESNDIIMSSESHKEFGNTLPLQVKQGRFHLSQNECVIRYIENKRVYYLKVNHVKEKSLD